MTAPESPVTPESTLSSEDVQQAISEGADLLRFATAGSVDDGKSTLIGRLLFDSKSIFADQLEAVEKTSTDKGHGYVDLSLLTDGLRSEREQGITIDVAYRYFATPNRKFIIADTPGHVQYTRNMVTGASTADLGLVLVDARQGLTEQSRRHAVLLSLLRVPHLVLCINKMDLVDWSEETYEKIHAEFTQFATKLNIPDLEVIPISALKGDNVVDRSENTPWYQGIRSDRSMTLSPVSALTGMTSTSSRSKRAAADRTPPANSSNTTCPKSTASSLLMATMTVRTPINAHTVRCRCVCCRMPRVASTSRIATSAVDAATAMLRVYCSWPGASAMMNLR